MLVVLKQIKELSKTEKYNNLIHLLKTIPGIGLIVGMTLVTEIIDISRFPTFSKFNSYVGICPSQFSSGDNIRMGKMTPRNNAFLRPLIIEASWIAIRNDPSLALEYKEMCQFKTPKRAIVTIARKLLSRVFIIWSTGMIYEKGLK